MVRSRSLSAEQRRRFDERGLLRLEGLIARDIAEQMADRLWEDLARRECVQRHDRATWRTERPWGFAALQKSSAFEAMATPELRGVLDDLIGEDRWAEPRNWGQPLVCFPTDAARWTLPHQVWHFDLTPDPRRSEAMVGRLFVLLAPLRANGGGTLVAAGSHRIAAALAERRRVHLSSQEMRSLMAREHAWFAQLMSPARAGGDRIGRFMGAATVVSEVEVQVEEITGEPGDVYLMHPNALHGPSANVLDAPRLALAQTVYPKGWLGA